MHFPIGRSRLMWMFRGPGDGPFGRPFPTSDEGSLTTSAGLVK